MKHLPKILMIAAALSLLGLFAFPLWRITLEAPQYPDGVTMYIYINKLGGDSPGTLQNVNILNHYIGMKYIEADAIPELQYFPYVIIGLVLLGLAAAFSNKRWAFLGWVGLLCLLGAIGIYDFYIWEYDYGHNLSPNAPIKIPDASFQPPLIGRKIILNFVAISMPYIGALFVAGSIALGMAAWWLKGKGGKTKSKPAQPSTGTKGQPRKVLQTLSIFVLAATLFGCSPEPKPIEYGADACDYCKMTIVDRQHAAEVVTGKGRVYKFDAIECMVNYIRREDDTEYAFLLVSDYTSPENMVNAGESTYLISKAIPSPMGAYLSAFNDAGEAREVQDSKGGELFSWEALKAHFQTESFSHVE